MQKEIETLKRQVAILLKWMEQRKQQQLVLPLDLVSQRLIKNL